jgi:hypothetical protein
LISVLAAILVAALGKPAQAADRTALVIGNSKYATARPLGNARRDAEAVSDRLRFLGFDVVELFDADARAMERALANFKLKSASAELSLVYFAGHGVQLFDDNFLLATDFDPDRLQSRADLGLQLSTLTTELRRSSSGRLILVIDACRDNPFGADTEAKLITNGARILGRSAAGAPAKLRRGLARIDASPEFGASGDPGENLIMFSAQPGNAALDGDGQNSPFAEALLVHLGRSELDVVGVFTEVARYVVETTKGFQRPELRMSWTTAGYRLSAASDARRVVRYLMSDSKPGDPLYEKNLDKLGEFYRSEFLRGPFNASATLLENISPDDWRYKARIERTKFDPRKVGLGYLNRFEFDLDLDGDGVEETLIVRSGQVGVEFYIRKAGLMRRFEPVCPEHDMNAGTRKTEFYYDEVDAVEVGILDINSNRKPDIWIIRHPKGGAGTWPDLCVLEPTGKYRQTDAAGWGAESTLFDPLMVVPLISNTGGWGVKVLPDKMIEICAGSYCANKWTFKWNGAQFEARRDDQHVKNFAAVGWPPVVHAKWAKDLGLPGIPVAPGRSTLPASLSAIRTYIINEYLQDREQFADRVDYYDKGIVSREFVLADQASYAAKWPTRTFELVENSLAILSQSQDRTTAAFRYRYVVSRPGKTATGSGAVQLTLRHVGAQLLVEAVKEAIDRK